MKVTPVILAGGGGQRLWPLSTPARPKPLLPLLGPKTLLAETAARFQDPALAPPMLSVGAAFAEAAMAEIEARTVLVEPTGRNTAAAVAAAALAAPADDALLLMAPADHAILDVEAFRAAIAAATPVAADGRLVVFGVAPERPETGYGYAVPEAGAGAIRPLARFVEKPEASIATGLIADGARWNAGMFLGRRDAFLAAFARHAPDVLAAVEASGARPASGRIDLGASFADAPALPFDKAVMEKTGAASLAPLDCGWSDVGDWDAVWRAGAKDDRGNVIVGDVRAVDCAGCYLRGEGARVAVAGLRDMAVIATAEATLTLPRAHAQAVRDLAGG